MFRVPDTGSRDALCSLIGDAITNARWDDEDWFQIDFESGAMLRIERDPEYPNHEPWYLARR